MDINCKSSGITLSDYIGTWYVIDTMCFGGQQMFLLESEQYGDMAECIIVNRFGDVLMDGVVNGFDDFLDSMD